MNTQEDSSPTASQEEVGGGDDGVGVGGGLVADVDMGGEEEDLKVAGEKKKGEKFKWVTS